MSEIFFARTANQLFRQIPVLLKLITRKSSLIIKPKVASWFTLKKTTDQIIFFLSFHISDYLEVGVQFEIYR